MRHSAPINCHPAPINCHPAPINCHPERNNCHPERNNCHPELVSGSSTNEMPKQVRHDNFVQVRHDNFVQVRHDKLRKIIPRILLALVCAYGLYAFIARGVWKYLILRQQFFFFDLERGYVLFALDYISIIILFATISQLIALRLKDAR